MVADRNSLFLCLMCSLRERMVLIFLPLFSFQISSQISIKILLFSSRSLSISERMLVFDSIRMCLLVGQWFPLVRRLGQKRCFQPGLFGTRYWGLEGLNCYFLDVPWILFETLRLEQSTPLSPLSSLFSLPLVRASSFSNQVLIALNFSKDCLNELIPIITIIFIEPMGGVTSASDLPHKYTVTHLSPQAIAHITSQPSCNLVKHLKTNEFLQEYQVIPSSTLSLEEELEFYQYRKLQNRHLVKVQYIKRNDSNRFCSHKQVYKVYTERIHIRLSEISDLIFMEALIMLVSVLDGLDTIKDGYQGILNLSDEMIGMNDRGAVKVWINPEYSRNQPGPGNIISGCYEEGKVVVRLFNLVRDRMGERQYPTDFANMIRNCAGWKYLEAIRFIKQYVEELGLELPRYLRRFSILKELKEVEEAAPFEFEINSVPYVPVIHLQPPTYYNQHLSSRYAMEPSQNRNNLNFSDNRNTGYQDGNRIVSNFQKSQSSNNTTATTLTLGIQMKPNHNSNPRLDAAMNANILGERIEDLSLNIKKQLQSLRKQLSISNH